MDQETQLPDTFIKKLILRHQLMSKNSLKECLKICKREKEHKNIISVLEDKPSSISENMEKPLSFLKFFQERFEGALLANLAIKAEAVSETNYRATLITQRSIFLLKNQIISLPDLLLVKGILDFETKKKLQEHQSSLSSQEFQNLSEKTLLYLEKEDIESVRWRKIRSEGNIGIKYKKKQVPPPSRMEEAQAPPPSRLEEDSINIASPLQKSEHFFSQSDLTEMIQVPKKEKKVYLSSGAWAAIICLFLISISLIFVVYLDRGKAKSDYKTLEALIGNKNWVEAEEKSRAFLQTYPRKKLSSVVKEYLQQILYIKAEIAYRQERLPEALSFVEELILLNSKNSHSELAVILRKEIQEGLEKEKEEALFIQAHQKIEQWLQKENIEEASHTLTELQSHPSSPANQDKLEKFRKKIAQVKENRELANYHLYPSSSLPPIAIKDTPKITHQRLLLGQPKEITEKKELSGYFFSVIHGYLHCIEPQSGQTIWVEHIGKDFLFSPLFLAGPREHHNMTLVDKVLVVNSLENSLVLLEVQSGKRIWQSPLPALISTQPKIYKKKIYVGCLDRHTYILNVEEGKVEGAYLSGDIPKYAPSFDKRLEINYIPCRNYIYGYERESGLLAFRIPYKGTLAAPPIAISPYLFVFTIQGNDTKIHLYLVQKKQYELVHTLSLPGKMKGPAALSSGILALATDSYLGIYGVNPANKKEAIFSLTGVSPLLMENDGSVFMQFSNFGENLLVLQKNVSYYSIKFQNRSNAVGKKWQLEINPGQADLSSIWPIQRLGDIYFITNQGPNKSYFISAFVMDNNQPKTLWEKQIGLTVKADMCLTNDDRLLALTTDGSLHEIHTSKQGENEKRLHYRVIPVGKDYGEKLPLYIPQKDKLLLLGKNHSLKLLDGITAWPAENWMAEVSSKGIIGPGACYSQDSLFFGAEDGVFAISLDNGKQNYLEFSEFRGKPFFSVPIFHENDLFIGNDNGNLYRLQTVQNKSIPFLQKKSVFSVKGAIRSIPAIEEETIYFGSDDNSFYAVDINSNRLKWSFQSEGKIRTQATIDEKQVYFGSHDRKIYALDKKNGSLVWQKSLKGKVTASPLEYQGKVYVASIAGDFHAIDSKTGKSLWQVSLGGGVVSRPILFSNKIFVAAHDGFLYLFDVDPK